MIYHPNLPEAACRAHIFHEIKSGSLLSMSQLCYQVFEVNFTEDAVSVILENQTIFTGPCNNNTGLCTVPLTPPLPPQPKPWVFPPTTFHYTHAIPKVHLPSVVHQAANNAFSTKTNIIWCRIYMRHASAL